MDFPKRKPTRLKEFDYSTPCPTISDVICVFKSLTTRLCKKEGLKEKRLFQASFHDHVVRGESDYIKIADYIDTNVLCWKSDCFYE